MKDAALRGPFHLLGAAVVVFGDKVEPTAIDRAFERVAIEFTGKFFAPLLEVETGIKAAAQVVDSGSPVAGKGGEPGLVWLRSLSGEGECGNNEEGAKANLRNMRVSW